VRRLRCKVGAKIGLVAFWIWAAVHVAWAGPPFVTDDPEPPEYRHWEIYFASQLADDSNGWSGTSPHVELDYGAIPNIQLSLIAPVAFDAPSRGRSQFGCGDTELGVKYRFIQEIFHETAKQEGGTSDTNFNLGTIFDFSAIWHFLFSAGHTIQGRSGFQAYTALEATFGPGESAASTTQ
jgi:hypothetical protein